MHLAFDGKDGTALGLVGPTVFSIGADEKHIVVMQHPSTNEFGTSWDRTITNYFVVERTVSPSHADRQKGVRGPMSKAEFDKLAMTVALPKFSKTFEDLK